MKVLILSPSGRMLGARQSLVALVEHLPPGCEAIVASPTETGLTQEIRAIGVPVEVVPQHPWRKLTGRFGALFSQIPRLRAIVEHFRPDVVHCNEFHPTPQAVRAARGKVGVTTHIRLGITARQVRNYDLGRTAGIAAVSDACAQLLEGSGLEDRTRVIPNGVPVGKLTASDPAMGLELRRQLGWGESDVVFALLGLISPRKNQLVAVEALARVAARHPHVRLLLAGDSFKGTADYGERLAERLRQPDVARHAAWLPFQTDVGPLYRAMDLNLLISAEEGFGRTIIEAGAVGVPSIGAATGGIPEIIAEGETGWLVPEGDANALATAMEAAIEQAGERQRRGEAARKRVLGEYDIRVHAQRMVEFWEWAAGNA